jgi:hypothetical protein
MRKLLTLLIALSANVVAVVSPVSAQGFNGGGFNVGLGPFASGGGGCTQATNFLARVTAASLTIDGTHTTAYTNLICGLVTDGLITGAMTGAQGSGADCNSTPGTGFFDGLYIYATNTTAGSAVTLTEMNLCGTSNTLTDGSGGSFTSHFTADRGYLPGANSDYFETGFNASTATSPTFTLNSAHFAVWNNTNSFDTNAVMGTGNVTSFNHMYAKFSDNNFYSRLNDSSAASGYAITNPQSLLIGNRSGSGAIQGYGNTAFPLHLSPSSTRRRGPIHFESASSKDGCDQDPAHRDPDGCERARQQTCLSCGAEAKPKAWVKQRILLHFPFAFRAARAWASLISNSARRSFSGRSKKLSITYNPRASSGCSLSILQSLKTQAVNASCSVA